MGSNPITRTVAIQILIRVEQLMIRRLLMFVTNW